MRVTYRITEGDALHDDGSNYLDHKNNAPDYNKDRQKLLNQIVKIVNTTINNSYNQHQCKIDIDAIAKKVIEKTKPHEKRQTKHIIKNAQDISDFNNVNIWQIQGNPD